MKTLTSVEVQSRFGEVLELAKHEPITVTQSGLPVVTFMRYEDAQGALRLLAGRKMSQFLRDLSVSSAGDPCSDDEVTRILRELGLRSN
jgi:hypothetical protein